MPPKSTKKSGQSSRDRELAERISKLRKLKGKTQRQFAEILNVTQAQISEWEKKGGSEQPSLERLIALGNLAPDPTDRMFFWRRAGLSDARLREDLSAEMLHLLERRKDDFFAAPLAKNIFLGAAGQLQTECDGTVAIPSMLATGTAEVFCVRVPEHRFGLQRTFRPGDYVVIERAAENPDRLVGSLIAAYLEHTPEGYELDPRSPGFDRIRQLVEQIRDTSEAHQVREKLRREQEEKLNDIEDPDAVLKSDERNNQIATDIEKSLCEPVFLFGRLVIQEAGDPARERNYRARPSRVAIELGRPGDLPIIVPLSDWELGHNPAEPKVSSRIHKQVHIVGPVIGWFEDRSQYRAEEAGTCERQV
jgi:transcriptional regulator with XRE-family HTH domain